jgi:predicted transcriptional regulator
MSFIKNMSDDEFKNVCNLSQNFDYAKNNLDKCWIPSIITSNSKNSEFNEEFILNNIKYFEPYLKFLFLNKKDFSDEFLMKIFTKQNYTELKLAHKQFNPQKDFKKFDNLFY